MTLDSRVDRRFWTLLQASFYETYQRRGHRIFPHRVLDWVSLRTAAGGADIREQPARAGTDVEVWAESGVPGPPEPRLR